MPNKEAQKTEIANTIRNDMNEKGWLKFFSVRDEKGTPPIAVVFNDEDIEDALNATHRASGSANLVIVSNEEPTFLLNIVRLSDDNVAINFDNTMNITVFAEWMMESEFHRNVILVSNQGRAYKVLNARRMPLE